MKKNQIALILLTLVLMLTVYFLKTPFQRDKDDGGRDPVEDIPTGRLEELATMRAALRDERSLAVMAFDEIIASNDRTVNEKNVAIEEKRRLQEVMEKEVLLELQIISDGFQDSFVHATDQGIEIIVVSDTHSSTLAVMIAQMAHMQFGVDIYNIGIDFKTVQQVMKKVA